MIGMLVLWGLVNGLFAAEDRLEVNMWFYCWVPGGDFELTQEGNDASGEYDFEEFDSVVDFMGSFHLELWKGKNGLVFDTTFLDLDLWTQYDTLLPDIYFHADLQQRVYSLAYARRFGDSDVTFDGSIGARYIYLKQRFNLTYVGSILGSQSRIVTHDQEWYEPYIGGRFNIKMNDKLTLQLGGNVGGFDDGDGESLNYGAEGILRITPNDTIFFEVGYRYADLSYSHGEGVDEFGLEARFYGPIFTFGLMF
jgi:hypothetical protein